MWTGGGGIGDGVLEALGVEMDLSLGGAVYVRIVFLFRRFRVLEIPFPQFLEDLHALVPERDSGIEGDLSLLGQGLVTSSRGGQMGGVLGQSWTECRPIPFLFLSSPSFLPRWTLVDFRWDQSSPSGKQGRMGEASLVTVGISHFSPRESALPIECPEKLTVLNKGTGRSGALALSIHPSTPTSLSRLPACHARCRRVDGVHRHPGQPCYTG